MPETRPKISYDVELHDGSGWRKGAVTGEADLESAARKLDELYLSNPFTPLRTRVVQVVETVVFEHVEEDDVP